MSDHVDAAYTRADWKPLLHRIEPYPGNRKLLLQVMVIRHRREADRSVLLTEILVRTDCPGEWRSEGGSTMELRGASDALCRQLFTECLERLLLPWEEGQG
jgi:hypothetical protein